IAPSAGVKSEHHRIARKSVKALPVDASARGAYRFELQPISGRRSPVPLEAKPLAFPSGALEPHIDKQTMEIHHGKHYATYVNNYNAALAKSAPQLDGRPLHEVLANNLSAVPDDIKTAVRNNGGGAHNHALFWEILNPAGKPGA